MRDGLTCVTVMSLAQDFNIFQDFFSIFADIIQLWLDFMTSESSKRVTKYGSYPVMADSIDQFILTSDVACCNFIIAVFLNMSIKTILNAATMFPLMAAAAGP